MSLGLDKPLIPLKEAAKLLSMSKSQLYGMAKRNEVPHHRLAGIKFSDSDIAEILEDARQEKREAIVQRKTSRIPRLKHLKLR